MIDRAVLDAAIQAGEVDTVIVAFPDQQGRLMGKRVTGRHFREHVADEGIHACDYLLTTDMQMEPLPGYLLASWDRGYGDIVIKPDWSTARRLPWLPGTALLIGDAQFADGRVVDVSPRAVLRAQIAEASKLGIRLKVASELEGYLFGDSYAEADAKGYRGIRRVSRYLEDYHVFQGTREEPILRPLRNHMEAAGVPMEGTKGEWGRGQVELNLAFADALEMADRHVILKHGAREISEQQGGSITFMAKYGPDEAGSSCHIHASAWDLSGTSNLFWSDGPSDLFGHFLAGQLALANELALFFAPTVNSYKRYQSLSWAPTAITWGRDNRTCGFRVVGHGASFRFENRLPGADVNPYLAFASTIGAGLYGIRHGLKLSDPFSGNAYEGGAGNRLPGTLREAISSLRQSNIAREVLGEQVVAHYLLSATHEADAYDRAVTDWERTRYFEQV